MPSCYRKQATWAETMVASREALAKIKTSSDFKPFVSKVLRGKQKPERVVVDVSGLDKLYLIATIGPDTYNFDQAVWGEPTLIDAKGKKTPLGQLKPASVRVGWGKLIKNKSHVGKPLRIGDRTFKHGLWAHAPSELCYKLGRTYVRFEAWVGIGIEADKVASSQFKVIDAPDPAGRLAGRIQRDFPTECRWFEGDLKSGGLEAWLHQRGGVASEIQLIRSALEDIGSGAGAFEERLRSLRKANVSGDDPRWLALYAEAAAARERFKQAKGVLDPKAIESLRLAVSDLTETFGSRYPKGKAYLARIDALAGKLDVIAKGLAQGDPKALEQVERLVALRREALLANPLLDVGKLLLIRRSTKSPRKGLPQNWQGNCSLPRKGYDDEIMVLSPVSPDGKLTTLYKPKRPVFVGDLELHYDAEKLLFSMNDERGLWQIYEIRIDGTGLRQVTPGKEDDVDNYDACYLPDERIIYSSTQTMVGVPCVYGSSHVANLCRMNPDGSGARQLCFDQDHNWCPTVLPSGRVMYLRWEYTDTPHSNTRILFDMNPDGTNQMELYGSNSYWPNGVFYARPIPNHPTQLVGIVTGHHGVPRMGEMVIFDPARGRHEAGGAVQRIPERGQEVKRVVKDRLVDGSWPKYLHPYPLSEPGTGCGAGTYFLVSAKPTPHSQWGIYLVDTFDNMVLLKEQPGDVLFEPVPVQRRVRPPVVPDRVDLSRKDAVVYLTDVYAGKGLEGIPRGTVKELRLFTYVYSYRGMGGLLGVIGMDGPWDVKRVLGTVPVKEDGSAIFRVPANTPISVQPLDEEGKALQLMRSWFTAMPGEVLSCVGCHERQNTTPLVTANSAAYTTPSEIEPWYGPERGFAFHREVQPVLDKHCATCHHGRPRKDGRCIPDLRGSKRITDWKSVCPGNGGGTGKAGQFSVSYAALHRFVRRPGIESDYHLLTPMEYHADTTELVQMLLKGHHGVRLDAEGWDRLITWIDLNAPYHGRWTDIEDKKKVAKIAERCVAMRKKYANLDVDYEAVPKTPAYDTTPALAHRGSPKPQPAPKCEGWPMSAGEAQQRQRAAGAWSRTVDLGDGVSMALVRVPAGTFVLGSATGHPDERPATRVTIKAPFWIGRCEVTNQQFARFDPLHDSKQESKRFYQFGVHGYPMNGPDQPVVRVSWRQAMAFCDWLSERTGMRCSLPTEAQWEYACRAGSASPFSYGGRDVDFSRYANLSDAEIAKLADNPYMVLSPLKNATKYDDWVPRDARFNDGAYVSCNVGRYRPNAWGLHDMHGNVAEWTRSLYRPYPYREDDGRNDAQAAGRRVVRGGSWYDRPKRARSAFRLAYRPYQRVYSVGFRVMCEAKGSPVARAK